MCFFNFASFPHLSSEKVFLWENITRKIDEKKKKFFKVCWTRLPHIGEETLAEKILNKQNQETEEERHRGGTYCATKTKTKAKTRNVNKHFWIDVAERKRDTIQATLARVKRKKRKFNLSAKPKLFKKYEEFLVPRGFWF